MWCFREVLENQHQIELLKAILDTLERSNLDIGESDDEEGSVRKMDKTLGGWLQSNTGSERDTLEGQFSEWDIKLQRLPEL
jgi:hypothetical protein